MIGRMTRTEHPGPAVGLHWLHLSSFFTLFATGLYVAMPIRGLLTMAIADAIHYTAMYIFILTTVVRIYWAYFGKGSANTASLVRVPDYKHFAMATSDFRTIGEWAQYYFFLRRERPYTPKYNPLQKIVYGYVFPLLIAAMAATGFAMYPPTRASLAWFGAALGGQNGVRLIHLQTMWVLTSLVMLHVYLVAVEDIRELPNMWLRFIPWTMRVVGDYPADQVPAENRTHVQAISHDAET